MCDDVGTKAEIPSLSPSYIIESSPNNFQYGYILSEPEPSIDKAKTLINHLVKSGYSDPGANGVVRLARLPGGINGKKDKPHKDFRVRLVLWEPTTTYSYSELLAYFKPKQKSSESFSDEDILFGIPDKVYEGGSKDSPGRDTTMTKICGRLIAKGVSLEAVLAKMIGYNEAICVPPLPISDITRIVQSVNSIHQRNQAERYGHILENIYHIKETNTWYDFSDDSEVTGQALDTAYAVEFPGGNNKPKKITKFLSEHPEAKRVVNRTWLPMPYQTEARVIHDGKRSLLNTWRGFAIEPSPGSVQPWLDLLAHVIPEEDYREALLWWMAYTMQHPDKKISWQPIIIGTQGAGKDALFEPLAKILGKAYRMGGNDSLVDGYDDDLYETKLLHISEAYGLSGKAIDHYKRITATEASDMQTLNIKSKAKVMQRNICSVVVISNNIDAMKFDREERRAFVLRAPEKLTEEQKSAYYEGWLHLGGSAHLFHYLLNYDLSKFTPTTRPYRTTHFDALLDITMSDSDIKMEELLSEFEAALPSLIIDHIGIDDRYNNLNKRVKAYLEGNGWVRWDSTAKMKDPKIRKSGEPKPESRDWYVKKGGKFDGCKARDMYDEAQRVRDIFAKKSKI